MQYDRNDVDFGRGTFRVRGDVIDIFPAESSDTALRVSLFDDEVETLTLFDPLTGVTKQRVGRYTVFPSSHYVTPRDTVLKACEKIKLELAERIQWYQKEGKLVEAQRIEQRTRFDLEMLYEMGFCKGIENYSRHFSGRAPGDAPPTLIDYLPKNALMFIDESHVTVPQVGAMYKGDAARKSNLVDYGFRLPSAVDNRPLKFHEFEKLMPQTIFVSATPAAMKKSTPVRWWSRWCVLPAWSTRHRNPPGGDSGGRFAVGNPPAHGPGRTGAGDHTDQAHGRATGRLLHRTRHQGALPAQRHRHRGAGGNHPRPAPGHVRRADRHQPAARRAGYSGGQPGGHSGCGQGRLPALGPLADPDHRPRCA
jgi:hypothetical protein